MKILNYNSEIQDSQSIKELRIFGKQAFLYHRVGAVSLVNVLGLCVYEKVGQARAILGCKIWQ